MATIKEKAMDYEPPQTKNVADLEVIPVDIPIESKTYKVGTPDEFTVNVISINGEDFRVPNSVLGNLKILMEEQPNIATFKVKKHGEGKNGTRYTVIPLSYNKEGINVTEEKIGEGNPSS